MKIVLKDTWMGRAKGTVLNLQEHMANRLIRWGTARAYDPERDNGNLEPSHVDKQIEEVPRHKMMRGAPKKKLFKT